MLCIQRQGRKEKGGDGTNYRGPALLKDSSPVLFLKINNEKGEQIKQFKTWTI